MRYHSHAPNETEYPMQLKEQQSMPSINKDKRKTLPQTGPKMSTQNTQQKKKALLKNEESEDNKTDKSFY